MEAALRTDPLVGTTLDGRYRIEGRIARGGMATVYRAVDARLDRTVAVKVMHPALAEDEEFVARFIREARAAARLSHPAVVAVHDQGSDAGRVFLVMDCVPGRTLRDLLRERGRLTPAQAVDVLDPVLAALGAAHRAGLVHRDVKPENVLLGDDGRIMVADFGLARAIEASSLTASTGLLLGTVAYLAPEQVLSGSSSARSDVYAAGILLYEMLAGAPPYAGETPLSIAYRHVHDDVRPPSTAVDGVPQALDDLVEWATRREPSERPADGGALLAELRRLRPALPVPGPAGSSVPGPTGLDAGPAPDTEETVAVRRPGQRDTLVQPLPRPPRAGATRRGGRPQRGRRLPLLAAALTALLVLAGAGWWYGVGRYTDAPGLLRLDVAAATERARAEGLSVRVRPDRVFDETVPVGQVLRQDPRPAGDVVRGGTVALVLSAGPERLAVPDLRGRTAAAARDALAAAGLRAGTATEVYDDVVPAGQVVRTDPAVRTPLRRDTVVALVVSRGPAPVPAPDVAGQPLAAARSALGGAGLTAEVVEEFSDDAPRGEVLRQEPRAGAVVPRGSAVRLVVSKGPDLVAVPDVDGLPRAEAEQLLRAQGFVPSVTAIPGPGIVRSTSPVAGRLARRGATVTLFVF